MKEETKRLLDEAAKSHYYSDFDTILWESLNADYIDRHTLGEDFKSIIETAIEDSKPKWISVAERLPEKFVDVLLKSKDTPDIAIGFNGQSNENFWCSETGVLMQHVTHWQPLPETDNL